MMKNGASGLVRIVCGRGRFGAADLAKCRCWRGLPEVDEPGFGFLTYLYLMTQKRWVQETRYTKAEVVSGADVVPPPDSFEEISGEEAADWFATKWDSPDVGGPSLDDIASDLLSRGLSRELALIECMRPRHQATAQEVSRNVLGDTTLDVSGAVTALVRDVNRHALGLGAYPLFDFAQYLEEVENGLVVEGVVTVRWTARGEALRADSGHVPRYERRMPVEIRAALGTRVLDSKYVPGNGQSPEPPGLTPDAGGGAPADTSGLPTGAGDRPQRAPSQARAPATEPDSPPEGGEIVFWGESEPGPWSVYEFEEVATRVVGELDDLSTMPHDVRMERAREIRGLDDGVEEIPEALSLTLERFHLACVRQARVIVSDYPSLDPQPFLTLTTLVNTAHCRLPNPPEMTEIRIAYRQAVTTNLVLRGLLGTAPDHEENPEMRPSAAPPSPAATHEPWRPAPEALTLDDRAVAVLTRWIKEGRSKLSMRKVAKALGCHHSSLAGCPMFLRLWELNRGVPRRGYRDAKSRNIESPDDVE